LLFKELVTAELESALEEVTGKGRTNASPNSAKALVTNDLTETTDQAAIIGDWVELYPCFDAVWMLVSLRRNLAYRYECLHLHIDGSECTVGD